MAEAMIGRLDLEAIEARANAATKGPWFPRATDDWALMNARYVSLDEGPGPEHDGVMGMDIGGEDQADSERVIAITLLQAPRLADNERFEENNTFIAHARDDVPALVGEVRRLRLELEAFAAREAALSNERFEALSLTGIAENDAAQWRTAIDAVQRERDRYRAALEAFMARDGWRESGGSAELVCGCPLCAEARAVLADGEAEVR